ncbi:hypothetical protein [Streptomyces sp. NPDC000410]|uniref:hypothetical protein n=1 Tax=Streptomyces sp. NPDC000410 TaxID=3154254 RepID=UPI00331AEB40
MTRTGVVFTIPWPLRVNPHLDQARDSAPAWMRRFGLLDGERAAQDFVDWRLAEVAAFFYPLSPRQCRGLLYGGTDDGLVLPAVRRPAGRWDRP